MKHNVNAERTASIRKWTEQIPKCNEVTVGDRSYRIDIADQSIDTRVNEFNVPYCSH